MTLPHLVLVDDDPQVLRALLRDMRTRYRDGYRVLGTESAGEALSLLQELRLRGDAVAMIVSDQRMPEMEGIRFLEISREYFPEARRVLLTAYADIDAAIRAINDVRLDYYLLKPWHPPEEKLYPVVDELLDEWQAGFRPQEAGIRLVGFQWSPKSHRIKEFFAGNLVPFTWIDVDEEEEAAEPLMKSAGISRSDLPLVVFEDGESAADPAPAEIARRLGLPSRASHEVYDVVIIGAGPAGLAAAVYGASEGLRTLVVERHAPGGQAGTSARIENYLGFPRGLSGSELTRRALAQARRFGTEMLTAQEAVSVRVQYPYKILELSDGTEVNTRAIVVTTGVSYRKLDGEGLDRFAGAGVYYGAAAVEAAACRDGVVYVVGGGNSAGQAAMFLSAFAREIHLVIRGQDLSQTASTYLIDQISKTPNIRILPCTEIVAAHGTQVLEAITTRDRATGAEAVVPARALFVYIGARPTTAWLGDAVLLDARGFVLTGRELLHARGFRPRWKLEREPFLLETSEPGIFASGDVRAGAMARIASAVGEGAMSIKQVHEYLAGG